MPPEDKFEERMVYADAQCYVGLFVVRYNATGTSFLCESDPIVVVWDALA